MTPCNRDPSNLLIFLVPLAGLEPARPYEQQILSSYCMRRQFPNIALLTRQDAIPIGITLPFGANPKDGAVLRIISLI